MNVSVPGKGRRQLQYVVDMLKFLRLYYKYRAFTMIHPSTYVENLALMAMALGNSRLDTGAIIECGTWKGGMSAGMIEVGGRQRQYCFFDSFEGLPPAQDIDGDAAKAWQSDTSSPLYYDNCNASIEEFERTIKLTGITDDRVEIKKGFFEDTLPGFVSPSVAVLRLDGDWYDSTMICLDKFWDQVIPSGIVLIDDYYIWDGCSRAVHDFLAKRQLPVRIRQGPIGKVAYILKE